MPTETEVKYRVESLDAVGDALKAQGATCVGDVVETDTFFDTPAGDLYRGDRGVRLRRTCEAGDGPCPGWLTYKGPREGGSRHKVREEIETTVGDVDAVAEVLRACGLREVMTIQKRRRRWDCNGCEVSLDELPLLGTFVEIESESTERIEQVRKLLSLDGEPITESYFQLLSEQCPRMGEKCRRATFDTCRRCEHGPSQ